MKKFISFPVLLITVSIFTGIFNNCNEDNQIIIPIDTEYAFDSARYDWSFDSIPGEIFTFNAFDTSNIFLLGVRAIIHYDGANLNYHYYADNSFYPLSIGSYNKNSIYIGGDDNSVKNSGMPRLKKWNGLTFEEIPIPNPNNNRYQFSAIFGVNEDETWMGSTRGDLIHYNQGNFEFLRLDSTFYFTMFGNDDLGNFYSVAVKTVFDSLTTNYLNIYKKVNDQWQWSLVFSEKYNMYDINEVQPTLINNYISGFQNNNIVKFIGNVFQEIFSIKPFNVYQVSRFSDTNTNFFLMPGLIENGRLELFHWNGSKWSKEVNFYETGIFPEGPITIENVEGKYFGLFVDRSFGFSFFGKGEKRLISNTIIK